MAGTARTHTASNGRRPAWRVVLLGGVLPALLWFSALFALALLAPATPEYMGVRDEATIAHIISLFQDQLALQQARIWLAYAVVALVLGGVAGLWRLAALRLRARRGAWPGDLLWGLTGAALLHGGFLLHSIGHYPQLYTPPFRPGEGLGGMLLWLGADGIPGALWPVLGFVALSAPLSTLTWLALARPLRPRAALAGAVLLLSGLLAAGVLGLAGPGAAPERRAGERPDVLLVVVDSLRADVLDDHPEAMPNLAALAAKGTFFAGAHTVMPRTFPSMVTLLTGRYPHAHGIRHMFPTAAEMGAIGDTVVRRFAAAGYRTAVVTDFAGDIFTRAPMGFDTIRAPSFSLASNVALGGLKLHPHLFPYLVDLVRGAGFPELRGFERLCDPLWLTDEATDFIDEEAGRPFFLLVFYSSGHFPYAAPAPYYERFTAPGYRGPSRFYKEAMDLGEGTTGPAEQAHVRDLYLGALAATDAALGRLLDEIAARGRRERTIVVVTGDHGENLYESDLGIGHGDHLYGQAGLRVPLVLAGPGWQGGGRIEATVANVDVAPSLARAAGLEGPAPLDGSPLQELLADPAASRPVFAETGLWFLTPSSPRLAGRRVVTSRGFEAFTVDPESWDISLLPRHHEALLVAKHRAVLAEGHKLVYVPTRDGVRRELFDLAADPHDERDLAAARPDLVERLGAQLDAWLDADPAIRREGGFVVPVGGDAPPYRPEENR